MGAYIYTVLQILVTVILSSAVILAIIKYGSDLFLGWLLKKIEYKNQRELEAFKASLIRQNTVELERLKADLAASYSAISSSVNFASASHKELRIKIIESIEFLWKLMLDIKDKFGDIHFIDTVFLSHEIDALFKSERNSPHFSSINRYQNQEIIVGMLKEIGSDDAEFHRVFAGEKLWLTFFIFRAFNGRVAYLYSQSFKEKKYVDWRKDESLKNLLSGIIREDFLVRSFDTKIGSINLIIGYLENIFLKEALSLMSGLRTLTETVNEIGSTILSEKENIEKSLNLK